MTRKRGNTLVVSSKESSLIYAVVSSAAAPAAFAIPRAGGCEVPADSSRRERGGAVHGAADYQVRLTSASNGGRETSTV